MDVDGRPYNTRGKRLDYRKLAGLAKGTTNPTVKVALQMVDQAPPDKKDAAMDALAAALEAAGLGVGGRRRTRKQKHKGKKHPRKTRKSRRGGVQPQRMTLTEAEEKYHQELEALKKTGNASPAEIAAAEKKWSDAYVKMRSVLGRPEPGYPHGQAFPRR
jgi:hypothetical protein